MNSEELELSLRNEFESCLKDKLAEIRQEMVKFQERVEAEFEKHKSQLDEVFQDFATRISANKPLDAGFTETVVEHLRLARDEGSRVAVAAMEEAEAMRAETEQPAPAPAPKAGISQLNTAISDISSKNTQSSILKTLVQHAAQFTPRGAFFIIKNEHLVGWRVFGKEGYADEQTVREVFFPVASETVPGEAARSLSAVESSYGTYADDSIYLNKLGFAHPERMFAVPLVVRGRSVAVLYADNGNDGEEVNIEALETLSRVASLTVEILASMRGVKTSEEASEQTQEVEDSGSLESGYAEQPQTETETPQETAEAGFVMTQPETVAEEEAETPVETISEPQESSSFEMVESSEETEKSQTEVAEETTEAEFVMTQPETEEGISEEPESVEFEEIPEPQEEMRTETEEVEEVKEEFSYYEPVVETPALTEDYSTPAFSDFEPVTNNYQIEPENQAEPAQSFEPAVEEFETPSFESTQFEFTAPQPTEEIVPAKSDFNGFEVESYKAETPVIEKVETVSEPVVTKQPTRSRFSDRNVDLPIEVSEDERRLHNDARRFARLLVSEIKLYNEQKVKEGRESSDLYERLREAIDRSREMYDKRVQPPVAARFDYFHYEVVSTLAEGDVNKLGTSYPGAAV